MPAASAEHGLYHQPLHGHDMVLTYLHPAPHLRERVSSSNLDALRASPSPRKPAARGFACIGLRIGKIVSNVESDSLRGRGGGVLMAVVGKHLLDAKLTSASDIVGLSADGGTSKYGLMACRHGIYERVDPSLENGINELAKTL